MIMITFQGDQLNMAMFFCFVLVKSDQKCTLDSGKVTFYLVPNEFGQVYLVTLYFMNNF